MACSFSDLERHDGRAPSAWVLASDHLRRGAGLPGLAPAQRRRGTSGRRGAGPAKPNSGRGVERSLPRRAGEGEELRGHPDADGVAAAVLGAGVAAAVAEEAGHRVEGAGLQRLAEHVEALVDLAPAWSVPRHLQVAAAGVAAGDADRPLPVGEGRCPSNFARSGARCPPRGRESGISSRHSTGSRAPGDLGRAAAASAAICVRARAASGRAVGVDPGAGEVGAARRSRACGRP